MPAEKRSCLKGIDTVRRSEKQTGDESERKKAFFNETERGVGGSERERERMNWVILITHVLRTYL